MYPTCSAWRARVPACRVALCVRHSSMPNAAVGGALCWNREEQLAALRQHAAAVHSYGLFVWLELRRLPQILLVLVRDVRSINTVSVFSLPPCGVCLLCGYRWFIL